jgi:hypothetical protein
MKGVMGATYVCSQKMQTWLELIQDLPASTVVHMTGQEAWMLLRNYCTGEPASAGRLQVCKKMVVVDKDRKRDAEQGHTGIETGQEVH